MIMFRTSDDDEVLKNHGSDEFNYVYVKPYCRISVYAMGMVLGYVLHKYFSKKFNLSLVRKLAHALIIHGENLKEIKINQCSLVLRFEITKC